MRNTEKDARDMALRRRKMLKIGFDLFSKNTIESVSMQQIANACGLGIATLYRYFPRKQEFVMAVSSACWQNIKEEFAALTEREKILEKGFDELLDFFLDCFIYLYDHHRDLLCFNYDFNRYVPTVEIEKESMKVHLGVITAFREGFNAVYSKGVTEGRLKSGVTVDGMFSAIVHLMLAAVTRYAVGLVYHANGGEDLRELRMLKNMLKREFTV